MIERKLKYKINFYALILLCFLIPLKREFIAPAFIFFIITSFINYKILKIEKVRFFLLLLPSILFVTYLVGLYRAHNVSDALNDLITKLPLLICPFAFWISHLNIKKILPQIVISLSFGCLLAFIYSLINSCTLYFQNNDLSSFFYGNISFFSHPSYIAMISNFCIIGLLYFYSKLNIKPLITILLVILLSIYIILLLSKTGLITFIITFLVFIFYVILKKKKIKLGILIISVLLTSFFSVFHFSKTFQNRILELSSITKNQNESSSSNARFMIWKIGIEKIIDNPIFGYGTGNGNNVLLKTYKERKLESLFQKKLNSHNQFIQSTLETGMIGGSIMILIFIIGIIYSCKENELLLLYFLLLILINLLTESMFERQVGVTFFAVLYSLLLVSNTRKNFK